MDPASENVPHLGQEFAKRRVLIVNTSEAQTALTPRFFEWAGFGEAALATDIASAIATAQTLSPDVVLLTADSLGLAETRCIKALREVGSPARLAPLLVCLQLASAETKQHALTLGASEAFSVPGDAWEILFRVRSALSTSALEGKLREVAAQKQAEMQKYVRLLETAAWDMHRRLVIVAELRDHPSQDHTKKVGLISSKIALELNMGDVDSNTIALAARLHDIGKVGIPDEILNKEGSMTPEEFEVMKEHTLIGARILAGGASPVIKMAEVIARTHHERWNGTGYPKGLAGDEIPLVGQIVGMVDTFDAMTRARSDRPGLSVDKALEALQSRSGELFDSRLVAILHRLCRQTAFREELLEAA